MNAARAQLHRIHLGVEPQFRAGLDGKFEVRQHRCLRTREARVRLEHADLIVGHRELWKPGAYGRCVHNLVWNLPLLGRLPGPRDDLAIWTPDHQTAAAREQLLAEISRQLVP